MKANNKVKKAKHINMMSIVEKLVFGSLLVGNTSEGFPAWLICVIICDRYAEVVKVMYVTLGFLVSEVLLFKLAPLSEQTRSFTILLLFAFYE